MRTLIFFILLSTASVYALPMGNPSEASLFYEATCSEYCCDDDDSFFLDIIRLEVGFYGDYVFQRHLETVTHRDIDYSQMYTNALYLALNYCDLFQIFSTLGATKFAFNTNLGPFNSGNTGPRFDFESTTAFSWSIGGRGTLFEYEYFALGVSGQYFSSCPKPKVLFVRANVDLYPDATTKRKYSEWQVGAGISYRYNPYFVPYIAVKYDRAYWNFDDVTFDVGGTLATLPSVKSCKNWGYAIGLTLAPFQCKKMAVTVEGRFVSETALYVNGLLEF